MTCPSTGLHRQAFRARQSGLISIESKEVRCICYQRRCNVQNVHGSMPTPGSVPGGKLLGFRVDGGPVARRYHQHPGADVCFDCVQVDHRHLRMKLLPENRESNCVNKFESSECR
jgi:hypothetical protein